MSDPGHAEVVYDGAGGFAISENGGGDMPLADVESLLAGTTYQNTSVLPTEGNRTIEPCSACHRHSHRPGTRSGVGADRHGPPLLGPSDHELTLVHACSSVPHVRGPQDGPIAGHETPMRVLAACGPCHGRPALLTFIRRE